MPISVRSYSQHGTTNDSFTVPKPQQVVAGDDLWAIHITSSTTATTAPGWTLIHSEQLFEKGLRIWRKTAGLSEPSSYTFTQPELGGSVVHIFAVEGSDATVAPNIVADLHNSSGNVVTPDVSPASVPHLEIRVASTAHYTGTLSPPSGYTLRGQAEDGVSFVVSAAATRVVNTSASSGTQVFVATPPDSGAVLGLSMSIASAPPSEPEIPTFPPFTPARGTALYQYRFRRLRDGGFLGFLELDDVSFDKRISQPGTFSASVPIPSRDVGDLVSEIIPRDSSVLTAGPGVIVVDILRGGDIWGEYWITSAKPGRSRRATPTIQLQGTTLDGYMTAVELQAQMFFEQADQIDILRGLVASMQDQPYANIGVTVADGVSGVLRDRTYSDDGGTYGQRIRELAEVNNGFEYTLDIGLSEGTISRQIRWGYPTLASDDVPHIFSDGFDGGDIVEWGEEIDALRGATRWRARGGTPPGEADASTTAQPLMSAVVEAVDHLDAGWPRIDRTLSYPDVTVQDTIDDYAAYWASVAPGALRVESYTVVLGANPSLHPNLIGDWCRIHLDNEWHRPHWRQRRIIGLHITPVSRDNGKEEAKLILEGLEVGG